MKVDELSINFEKNNKDIKVKLHQRYLEER